VIASGAISTVEHLITMDAVQTDDTRVQTVADVAALGRKQSDDELERRLAALTDTTTSLLIYTSGTTGTPKAVQLNERGMRAVSDALIARYPFLQGNNYRIVSYLPLCHIAEQVFTNCLGISTGGQVTFCPDIKKLKDYLVEVRPTAFLGVPRVWEKFQAALEARFAETTGLRGKLASWARTTELAAFEEEARTLQPVTSLSRKIANRLVIGKVKAALGLDQIVMAATGAAPIGRDTLDFFASLGLPLIEAYGMSETTGVATTSPGDRIRFGTVGLPLEGVDVRIAEDGEILLRGPNMTVGYLRQPEKTAELLDAEGWLHTGDLGAIDADGYLSITGRKKDILITAGGKNVAPAEMEAYIRSIAGVGQAVVVGDRKPYLAALITLDPETLQELCRTVGITASTIEEAVGQPELVAHVHACVEASCNANVARYQTIKRFQLLPQEFSVETGELTPTMKLKRNVVTVKFANEIETLYVR
jgi:long-chain acyl-CoA synthetase